MPKLDVALIPKYNLRLPAVELVKTYALLAGLAFLYSKPLCCIASLDRKASVGSL